MERAGGSLGNSQQDKNFWAEPGAWEGGAVTGRSHVSGVSSPGL